MICTIVSPPRDGWTITAALSDVGRLIFSGIAGPYFLETDHVGPFGF